MSRESISETLRVRLEEWAEWYGRDQAHGLGYPRYSLVYRLTRGGIGTPGQPVLPICDAAEEMEAWVCEMAQQHAWMARALRCYYFHAGSLRQHAQRLEISHMQFNLYLQMAHQWLTGRWTERYNPLILNRKKRRIVL